MVSCGSTSERAAAGLHALVAGLYVAMLVFHVLSVRAHWKRR